MKRIFTFVLTMAMMLCLAACAVPTGNDTSRKNGLGCAFSSAVDIAIDRIEASGEIKRYGEGVWEIEFSEPNTLSGVKLEFSEGNVLASYKGLSFSVPQSAVPVKAMMLNLIKAVEDNARLAELSGEESGGMLKISGSLDGGDYTLSVDKDGLLSGFEMPNNKLTMRFSEMKTAEITIEQSASETSTENTAAVETTAADTTSSEQ
ncbi:MAG: hypothetical protein J6X85_07880 [Ruminococcus sp.]|nr:hypothetical protein [Ruminococcus sp.]